MFDSHVWKEHARRRTCRSRQGALARVRAAESKRKFQEAHEHRCLDSSSQGRLKTTRWLGYVWLKFWQFSGFQ